MKNMFPISAIQAFELESLQKVLKTKNPNPDKTRLATLDICFENVERRFDIRLTPHIVLQGSYICNGDNKVLVKGAFGNTVSDAYIVNFDKNKHVSMDYVSNATPYGVESIMLKIKVDHKISLSLSKANMNNTGSKSYRVGIDNYPDIISYDNDKREYLIVLCPGDVLEIAYNYYKAYLINCAYEERRVNNVTLNGLGLKLMFKELNSRYYPIMSAAHSRFIGEIQEQVQN